MKATIQSLLIIMFFSQISMAQKFDGLALTPPMGWNSWNEFSCGINEQLIMEMGDAMAESGIKDAGYK